MNEYRDSLKYNPSYRREDTRIKITGKRTQRDNKKYRARQLMKRRIMALALAGGMTVGAIGIGATIKKFSEVQEEKYVSNMEEIEKYNITAQDLQISPQIYEHIMSLSEELDQAKQNKFNGISNTELAEYYSEMAELYLDILKGKISTVTGMKTSEFTLVAPSSSGTEQIGTQVKDRDMLSAIGINLNSDEIDDYMNDILNLRNYRSQIANEDINRDRLENKLMDYKDELGEIATLNLLKEMPNKHGITKLTTYRIETRDLQQSQSTERTSEMEK